MGHHLGKYAAVDSREEIQRIRCSELPGFEFTEHFLNSDRVDEIATAVVIRL